MPANIAGLMPGGGLRVKRLGGCRGFGVEGRVRYSSKASGCGIVGRVKKKFGCLETSAFLSAPSLDSENVCGRSGILHDVHNEFADWKI